MDILIVCPTADRLFVPTLRSMFRLRSVGGGRLDRLFLTDGDERVNDGRDRIAMKYEAARRAALDGMYDAMLCIESDMLVPTDTLERFVSIGAPVMYGLYVFRRPPWTWNAYTALDGMMGYPLSCFLDDARASWGYDVAVDGIGLGCTLIHRSIFEHIPFRADGPRHPDGSRSHCDWYFALDCVNRDIPQRCDTGVVCGHISPSDRDGEPNPSVIWPDITSEPDFVRFDEFTYPIG